MAVGYNAQFNALGLGLEADLQGADISDTTGFGWRRAFTQATTDIEWFSTVRGRIGYAAGPALLYVTGGWAFADVNTSVTSSGGSVPSRWAATTSNRATRSAAVSSGRSRRIGR